MRALSLCAIVALIAMCCAATGTQLGDPIEQPPSLLGRVNIPTGTFVQKQCWNSNCTEACTNRTLPLDQCFKLSGGRGSAMATCMPDGLVLSEYSLSETCHPPGYGWVLPPAGQCSSTQGNGFFEYEYSCRTSTGGKAVDAATASHEHP